jgi:hypothetical protein
MLERRSVSCSCRRPATGGGALVGALVLTLSLVLAASGCGGDDDGGDDGGEETAPVSAPEGLGVEIDPASGPAGTEISWTISDCEASDEKGVAIYTGPLDEYRSGAKSKRVLEGPESKEPSGTITVPDDMAPGEYVISGTCFSSEELGGGQVQLGVKEGSTAFTVTE